MTPTIPRPDAVPPGFGAGMYATAIEIHVEMSEWHRAVKDVPAKHRAEVTAHLRFMAPRYRAMRGQG